MKLLRLKLNVSFRSLAAGFEIRFLDDGAHEAGDATLSTARAFDFHPYCLAGRNGSGKSNVLEAIAAIFYHIECIHLTSRPATFAFDAETNPEGFRAENATPDAFELDYLISNDEIVVREGWRNPVEGTVYRVRIVKEAGKRPIVRCQRARSTYEETEFELTPAEIKSFLPGYVLGYSSGHNEVLSLPFFKMRFIHFDEYRDYLAKDLRYDGRPEGRMIYLDEQFSQAIVLCHFLFPSEAVTTTFTSAAGLQGIRRFRIIIRRHHRVAIAPERLRSLDSGDQSDSAHNSVELTSMLASHYNENGELQLGLIDKLIKCSTTHYEDTSPYRDDDSSDLLLDFWVTDETRRAFRHHFGVGVGGSEDLSRAASALNLFQALQTLMTLNYYQVDEKTKAELYRSDSLYLNETIPLPASHERIMRFKEFEIIKEGVTSKLYSKALSDGEHQLIHTVGLCLLFRHKPALFLLDEPETHLNPDWRASYISTLRSAFEADPATRGIMREVLLTTHSPFIISDCRRDNVLVFEKDAHGEVSWHNPDFNTFGASANAITMKVFNQRETIGDYAKSKLDELSERLQRGESPDSLIAEAGRELGDSVEKVLFINQALDKSEGR